MAGGLILRIRLRFHNHAPEQAAVVLAFNEAATHQFRRHDLCRAAEKAVENWLERLGSDESDLKNLPKVGGTSQFKREQAQEKNIWVLRLQAAGRQEIY